MDVIQECANNYRNLVGTTSYIFHTSLNKKITVFSVDFKTEDFHHAICLQYLEDISIPRNKKKTIECILNPDKPVSEEHLSKDSKYKGKPNEERDIELRISEFRYIEEYLDEENIVYIYSPKDSPYKGSIIPCDYIIESNLKTRNHTVFIFVRHRSGKDSSCVIVSFGVKKNVQYGGIYEYVMLKDKILNGNRINLYKHPRYTCEQILENEPSAKADYIEKLKEEEIDKTKKL